MDDRFSRLSLSKIPNFIDRIGYQLFVYVKHVHKKETDIDWHRADALYIQVAASAHCSSGIMSG
jgi:hypothetical protein